MLTLACEREEGKRRLRVSRYRHIFLRNSVSLFDQVTALFSYCILIAEAVFTTRGRCVKVPEGGFRNFPHQITKSNFFTLHLKVYLNRDLCMDNVIEI